jgi:hypothetical protein
VPVTGSDGWTRLTNESTKILDLSQAGKGEWEPPISAMGGPPSYELYHDLVTHAGLRVLKDYDGHPWVEMQDGERRRTFPVPSLELRAALDRFRMRRNLRPVPESDILEFSRVVEARASDPDATIPSTETPSPGTAEPDPSDAETPTPETPALETAPEEPAPEISDNWAVDHLDRLMQEVDEIQGRAPPEAPPTERPSMWTKYVHPVPLHSRLPHRWHASVSGAAKEPAGTDRALPRYLRALRDLVRDGTWIGPLSEIGRRTGDDSEQVFENLLRYHSDLIGNDLVVAPVEVEDGWRWVVVDRSRVRGPDSDDVEPS